MPMHPPLYMKTALGSLYLNKCYRFILDDYLATKNDTWVLADLYNQFEIMPVDALIEEEIIIVIQKEFVQLAFNVEDKETNRLLMHLSRGIHHWAELEIALSDVRRCSSTRLRNLISHLRNFNLVELINLPASSTCIISLTTPEYEIILENVAEVSEVFDFPYIEPQEEELKEYQRLVELEEKILNRK